MGGVVYIKGGVEDAFFVGRGGVGCEGMGKKGKRDKGVIKSREAKVCEKVKWYI